MDLNAAAVLKKEFEIRMTSVMVTAEKFVLRVRAFANSVPISRSLGSVLLVTSLVERITIATAGLAYGEARHLRLP
eukprot:2372487-Amphidinium_carterae.1